MTASVYPSSQLSCFNLFLFVFSCFFCFPVGCPSQTESLKERWPCSQSCYLSFSCRCDSGLFVENEFAHKKVKNVTQGLKTILISMSSTRHQMTVYLVLRGLTRSFKWSIIHWVAQFVLKIFGRNVFHLTPTRAVAFSAFSNVCFKRMLLSLGKCQALKV